MNKTTMNTLKHKQPNYRYGLNKKTRHIVKQGVIILLSICLIGGYVRSRTNNQSFITSNNLEANAWDEHISEHSSTLDNDGLGGEGDQVKEKVGAIQVVVPTPTPTTPSSPTTQRQEIENYVREVFGDDAERGLRMLEECENRTLGVDRINWNSNGTWDFGLWQINQVHGYTREQLADYKFNTDVAYKIFVNAGYSYSAWTCAETAGDVPFWK